MSVHSLFATSVYAARLPGKVAQPLNRQLLREAHQLRDDDDAGQRWSRANYPDGYTSYGSVHRLHQISPTIADLKAHLDGHVARFARLLAWDLKGRRLEMTDSWANIMGRCAVHGLHLHPLSSISGTYYVRMPKGAASVKFEDPRLDKMMAAPPRRATVRRALQTWVSFPAAAGDLLLFESWLRHEVPSHPVEGERVSISFNYNWF